MNEDQKAVAALMKMFDDRVPRYAIEHAIMLALHNAYLRGAQAMLNVPAGAKTPSAC